MEKHPPAHTKLPLQMDSGILGSNESCQPSVGITKICPKNCTNAFHCTIDNSHYVRELCAERACIRAQAHILKDNFAWIIIEKERGRLCCCDKSSNFRLRMENWYLKLGKCLLAEKFDPNAHPIHGMCGINFNKCGVCVYVLYGMRYTAKKHKNWHLKFSIHSPVYLARTHTRAPNKAHDRITYEHAHTEQRFVL